MVEIIEQERKPISSAKAKFLGIARMFRKQYLIALFLMGFMLALLYWMNLESTQGTEKLEKTVASVTNKSQSTDFAYVTSFYPWAVYPIVIDVGSIRSQTVYESWLVYNEETTNPLTLTVQLLNMSTGYTRTLHIGQHIPCWPDGRVELFAEWLVMEAWCATEDYEAYAFNIMTDELIIIPPPANAPPSMTSVSSVAIDGTEIVLTLHQPFTNITDLFIYDVQTRQSAFLTENGSSRQEYNADIQNGWVTWDSYDPDDTNHLIEIYQLSSNTHITLTQTTGGDPQIYGDWVVWSEAISATNFDIWGYNIQTSQSTPLVTDPKGQILDNVHQNLVTYREESSPGSYIYETIWVYDLDTEMSSLVFDGGVSDVNFIDEVGIYEALLYWDQEDSTGLRSIVGARQLPIRFFLPQINR